MAIDFVTAGFNALAGIAGDVAPLINDAVAQKYAKEYTDSIKEYNAIMSASPYDPDALNAHLLRLDDASGQAIGSISDCSQVAVPSIQLNSLVQQGHYAIFLVKTLTRLQSLKSGT